MANVHEWRYNRTGCQVWERRKEKMKYHPKPHKKTEDKKSYITKIREEEQKKRDRLKKTNDKKNEDDSEKVDDNSQ